MIRIWTVILPLVPLSLLLTAVLLVMPVPDGAFGLESGLAELYQYNPGGMEFVNTDITSDLCRSLRLADTYGVLVMKRAGGDYIPKSVLEAAGLCEKENLNLLLYGFLKVTGGYYDLEVKLFDAEAGAIKKVFYSKAGPDEYENLVEVMTERILDYFNNVLGVIKRKREAEKKHGVIELETGLGYWFPFGSWDGPLMGLGSFHVSGSLIPVDPLFSLDIFTFALGYGLSAEYAPGMNREGYESFLFHTMRFGFPVMLSARWYTRNRVILQVTPGLQLDILVQDRLYGNTVTEKSGAFSLTAALGYEYIFGGNNFSLGGMMRFHTAFYTDVLFTLEPALYVRYRLIRKRSEP